VTNLGCGDIYDWSTGLIYKNGRYFDPTLGIWLALASLVMGGGWFANGHRRRRRGEKEKRYVLSLLLLLLAMGLSGCGDTPTPPPGTATPEATRECPPTPTPTLPPPPVDDWDLKRKTVQITRIRPGDNENTENHAYSLGTVVDGGYAIITHNHFVAGKAEKVIISAHHGREILAAFDNEDDITKSEINAQTLRWQLPEMLESRSIHTAEIGDASTLRGGDVVSLPYRNDKGRVDILHTEVSSIEIPPEGEDRAAMPGKSVLSAYTFNHEERLKGGDSGGGLFHHGKLVGNSWFIMPRTIDGTTYNLTISALYIP
jgi:hypothetical protein